ncbi:MAG TPA: DUF2059 domain-containing protein [Rhizomicrobium sp.]|nr:DUF2059 domain-containing protein [Rhizomicrobium sp.]
MKRWIVPGFLFLLSCIPASAQVASTPDSAKVALGRDIYDLIQSSQNIAQRMQALASAIAQSMPKDKSDKVETGMKVAAQAVEDLRPKIRDAWATTFANHFSLDELQAIKQFYLSPAGSKLIVEQPEISKEMITTIMPELMANMQARIATDSKKESKP